METVYQTDPGKVRSHNEDSVNIVKNLKIFMELLYITKQKKMQNLLKLLKIEKLLDLMLMLDIMKVLKMQFVLNLLTNKMKLLKEQQEIIMKNMNLNLMKKNNMIL